MASRPVPPQISAADPGSYARHAVTVRQPRIIEQVLEGNSLSPGAVSALHALRSQIPGGDITSPFGGQRLSGFEHEEKETWEEQIEAQRGRNWLGIPWYFAEAYFYLRLLLAVGYYGGDGGGSADEGPGRDPFRAQKERELMAPSGGLVMGRRVLASADGMDDDQAFAFLLHASLWGNRLDLSAFEMDEARRKDALSRDRESLLVDHTEQAREAADGAHRVQVLLDNAGPELVCDLLLVDGLLARGAAGRGPSSVVLHAKKAPMFVSDVTTADTLHAVDVLAADADSRVSAAGTRLREALRTGTLRVREHWFWNSPRHFTAFPEALRTELAGCDLILVKGDANYRRILEDRKWDMASSLDELASGFPAPFVALRTMKSEVVVDVPRDRARELFRADPRWMVNGKRGLIRFCNTRS